MSNGWRRVSNWFRKGNSGRRVAQDKAEAEISQPSAEAVREAEEVTEQVSAQEAEQVSDPMSEAISERTAEQIPEEKAAENIEKEAEQTSEQTSEEESYFFDEDDDEEEEIDIRSLVFSKEKNADEEEKPADKFIEDDYEEEDPAEGFAEEEPAEESEEEAEEEDSPAHKIVEDDYEEEDPSEGFAEEKPVETVAEEEPVEESKEEAEEEDSPTHKIVEDDYEEEDPAEGFAEEEASEESEEDAEEEDSPAHKIVEDDYEEEDPSEGFAEEKPVEEVVEEETAEESEEDDSEDNSADEIAEPDPEEERAEMFAEDNGRTSVYVKYNKKSKAGKEKKKKKGFLFKKADSEKSEKAEKPAKVEKPEKAEKIKKSDENRGCNSMLKDFVKTERPEKAVVKAQLKEQQAALAANQMKIKDAKLPVMVIFEGWGAAGKGSVIGNVINNIDPRFFQVATMDSEPTEEERRKPFLYRYMVEIPEAGKFKFFDTCWMGEVTNGRLKGHMTETQYEKRINSINTAERQLTDNGYLVVKFFFQISQKQQKKRLKDLMESQDTEWRVNTDDLWENHHYDKCLEVYERYLNDTNRSASPWYIIDASNKKWAELQVLSFLNQSIDTALKNHALASPIRQNPFPLEKMPLLADVDIHKEISEEEYKEKLSQLQSELRALHYKLYRRKIPVIIAYEGWDAAGKGGNIKRIAEALDPRGYIVHPIASPERQEKARLHLWRFWNRLPKTGHIAIFDRTWYGRLMVERLEGFCSENDWQRAYNEINEFEKELVDWGAVVIKFWVHIDSDTQLARFNDRANTPGKEWKITDEDWRNREKWDLYEGAVNEMLQKTSTKFAPWYILESVDKKYARIKALQIVVDTLKKACEED